MKTNLNYPIIVIYWYIHEILLFAVFLNLFSFLVLKSYKLGNTFEFLGYLKLIYYHIYFLNYNQNNFLFKGQRVWGLEKQEGPETAGGPLWSPWGDPPLHGERGGGARHFVGKIAENRLAWDQERVLQAKLGDWRGELKQKFGCVLDDFLYLNNT